MCAAPMAGMSGGPVLMRLWSDTFAGATALVPAHLDIVQLDARWHELDTCINRGRIDLLVTKAGPKTQRRLVDLATKRGVPTVVF